MDLARSYQHRAALHSRSKRSVTARVLQQPRPGTDGLPPAPLTSTDNTVLSLQERLILSKHLNSLLSDSDTEAYEHLKRRADVASQADPAPAATPSGRGTAAQGEDELVHIFSYGANMACETLSRREVRVASRDPATVRDASVRMVFKHRGGYATLESLPTGTQPRFPPMALGGQTPRVHGVLYSLRRGDLKKLQQREQGYALTQMEVETYDGRVVPGAYVFVSGPLSRLPREVVPCERYMRTLREGAAFNFLDPVYQAWLSSVETVTGAGLGPEYYNTPSRAIAYGLLSCVAAIVGGFIATHT